MRYNRPRRPSQSRPVMPTTFAVLGAGAWGTAVAVHLAQNPQHRVRLWCARPESYRELSECRENVRLLPGVPIPAEVTITDDPEQALASVDLCVSAVPTVYLRITLHRLAGLVPRHVPVLSLSKGVEIDTFLRPTEILSELWGTERLAVLSGPSHAEEVSRGLPTSLVAASADLDLARWVQQCFTSDRFRVYTN